MNPDDPRLAQGPAVDPCPNPGKAAAYRKERLQPLDLSAYPDFDQPAGPIGSTAQKAADGTPLRPHLKDHSADRLPVFYLHDSLGIAESLAEQYAQTLDQLRQVVAGLPALKDVEDLDPAVAAMNTEQKQHYFVQRFWDTGCFSTPTSWPIKSIGTPCTRISDDISSDPKNPYSILASASSAPGNTGSAA